MRKWKKYMAISLASAVFAGSLPAIRALGDGPEDEGTVTEAPGDAPGAEEPSTEEPSTEVPTEAPTTEAPATEGPTTEAPATEAPSTETPTDNPGEDDPSRPSTEKPIDQPTTEYVDPGEESTEDDPLDVEVVQPTVLPDGTLIYDPEALAALQQQALKLKEDKRILQQELNTLLESQNDYITRLRILDEKIIAIQDRMDALEEQRVICENTIANLQGQLEEAQAKEQEQYETLKIHIQNEYENGYVSIYDFLFQSAEYAELINRVEYISEVNHYEQDKLDELSDTRRSIADQKLVMETMISDIGVVEETYEEQQEILQMYSDAKVKQIQSYQSDIDAAKAGIATIEELETQQTVAIAQLEARFRATAAAASANTSAYDGEKLLWPMPYSSQISSYFGLRKTPNVAGATADHRGIDIPCPVGSPCLAAASGTVMYTGYMGTGGNAVLIDCGNGITLIYYHLSGFNVMVGQKVNAGDVVAFSGNTGSSSGPHLHFGVRLNGEYQNPLDFLL